jgi:hypothetical protein
MKRSEKTNKTTLPSEWRSTLKKDLTGLDYRQSENLFERIEVAIPVQQWMSLLKAEHGDQAIDGLADGSASLAERPKFRAPATYEFRTFRLAQFEVAKFTLDAKEGGVAANALQDFAGN